MKAISLATSWRDDLRERVALEDCDVCWMGALGENRVNEQGIVLCAACQCAGNNSCGHDCLSEEWSCTLLPNGVCACCHIDRHHLRHAQEAHDGQAALEFAEARRG